MLAYAADRRRIAAPRSAPHAMLGIMVAHIAVIAAVMSAKLDLPERIQRTITHTYNVPLPPPPREPERTQEPPKQSKAVIDRPITLVPLLQPDADPIDTTPTPVPLPGDLVGPGVDPKPGLRPIPASVLVGPRFATPAGLVRPPYPPSKISSEEEAVLKLRLSIDVGGRVVSVEPVGPVDRAFLDAARRHILARWRYKPAIEDGRAVASSTVITLRFELD